jgi:hypothetical protein
MHLDNVPVKISPHLLEKSQMFKDALSSVADPSVAMDFTLAAPEEWLRAWVACYGSEGERLGNTDIGDLIYCLMVHFRPCIVRSGRRVDDLFVNTNLILFSRRHCHHVVN